MDNPGYSQFLLKGGIDTASTDLLDVARVEQRLKYLGYAAIDTTSGKPSTEIAVDGSLMTKNNRHLKCMRPWCAIPLR